MQELKRTYNTLVAICFPGAFCVVNLRAWCQVLQDRSSPYTSTILGFIERPFRNICGVVSNHVAGRSVASNNVRTFHAIFIDVSFTDAKLDTPFPNNLGKVTSASSSTGLSKRVSRIAYLVVPSFEMYVVRILILTITIAQFSNLIGY